jgi:hypothetical protein
MLHHLWAGALQIGQEAIPTALGIAAMTVALVRAHLETVEALMFAVVLLLIVLVL